MSSPERSSLGGWFRWVEVVDGRALESFVVVLVCKVVENTCVVLESSSSEESIGVRVGARNRRA